MFFNAAQPTEKSQISRVCKTRHHESGDECHLVASSINSSHRVSYYADMQGVSNTVKVAISGVECQASINSSQLVARNLTELAEFQQKLSPDNWQEDTPENIADTTSNHIADETQINSDDSHGTNNPHNANSRNSLDAQNHHSNQTNNSIAEQLAIVIRSWEFLSPIIRAAIVSIITEDQR